LENTLKYEEAIKKFDGSARKMAEALGVSVPAVQYWKSTGQIPSVRAFQIKVLIDDNKDI